MITAVAYHGTNGRKGFVNTKFRELKEAGDLLRHDRFLPSVFWGNSEPRFFRSRNIYHAQLLFSAPCESVFPFLHFDRSILVRHFSDYFKSALWIYSFSFRSLLMNISGLNPGNQQESSSIDFEARNLESRGIFKRKGIELLLSKVSLVKLEYHVSILKITPCGASSNSTRLSARSPCLSQQQQQQLFPPFKASLRRERAAL